MKSIDEELVEGIRRRLERPVSLIGMMGVGKTRLGKKLSKVLDLPFFDSDHEIEKAAGMDIAEIFDRFGEEYFRDGERRVLKRLIDDQKKVISTGGGSILSQETAQRIWDGTHSIWIKADLDIMLERTGKNDNRPLLKEGDPEEIFKKLIGERYPVYERADIVVESHNGPFEAILNQTLEKLDTHLRRQMVKTGS